MSKDKNQISLSRYPVIPLSRSTGNRLMPPLAAPRHSAVAGNGLTILVLSFLTLFSLLFAQDEFIYDAKGKRDPFIPLVTSDGRLLKLEREETPAELLLEGIIYDKYGLSYAIVNQAVVRIGDKINDYQVLKIEKDKVIFIKDGQLTEVELKKEEE